jgi:hypothetical protein
LAGGIIPGTSYLASQATCYKVGLSELFLRALNNQAQSIVIYLTTAAAKLDYPSCFYEHSSGLKEKISKHNSSSLDNSSRKLKYLVTRK